MPRDGMVHIGLEIAANAEPVTGSVCNAAGDRIEFCGWTAFAAAVERLLDDAAMTPGAPVSSAGDR